MTKQEEVRIRIRSVRYEVEASLFSDENDFFMKEETETPEPESVELSVVGRCTTENGRIQISYDETEATGMDGSVTSVSFLIDQPGIVSMIREGQVSTVLVFEAGKRHHCVYNTPFMPFEVCVHTVKVENRLSDGGYLNLDYMIEIRGARAERTRFCMELL